jgi:hypothetical protein
LRLDEQLIAECVKSLDVSRAKAFVQIGLRIACGVPNDALRQRLAGGVYDAIEFATHSSPAVRLPIQVDDENWADARSSTIRGRRECEALLPRQKVSALQEY